MSLTVLRVAPDTVETSFTGVPFEEWLAAFEGDKSRAQYADGPVPVMVGVVELFMQPKSFGTWSYVLRNAEFEIRLSRTGSANRVSASIRLSAFGLANTEPRLLFSLACSTLGEIGDYREYRLSRFDVCADVQGFVPTAPVMANVVCAASYRATHGTAEAVQTFMFGKGQRAVRAYDKTAEIPKSGKTWLYGLWRQHPEYDRDLPVWRWECQFRRQALDELGFHSTEQGLDGAARLLDSGLRWAQLRVPEGQIKTRWAEDERWTAIRTGTGVDCVPLDKTVKVSEMLDLDAVIVRQIGAVATAAAYFETTDYLGALQRLSFAVEAHMMREKVDFAASVEQRRRRILGG